MSRAIGGTIAEKLRSSHIYPGDIRDQAADALVALEAENAALKQERDDLKKLMDGGLDATTKRLKPWADLIRDKLAAEAERDRLRTELELSDTMLEALQVQLQSWKIEPVINIDRQRKINASVLSPSETEEGG